MDWNFEFFRRLFGPTMMQIAWLSKKGGITSFIGNNNLVLSLRYLAVNWLSLQGR